MRPPWWMEGVAFSCQANCGKCCDEPGGIVYLSITDAERISKHHKMEVEDWLERDCRQTLDGRYVLKSRPVDDVCIYLDGNKQCTIYTVRPQQCAAFPWWGENLATDRAWKEVKETCPGLTADDALVIDGESIRIHVFADRESTKGFRSWPPWNRK
ncbi:YkgJ family cysteine cluster protein [Candidatus Poseidoniaceae archaeon]|nr:YkgJ family cysteine cluster protein [Euryarchaeota archaeon]MDA9165950.1 YkgJ family cysteine cluster protein [Candidatus Poseidoniaceae archaeon]MDA8568025.1 YkgJ family cysteine cluster protein [Euryarchaeota archaeon]MDA8593981.1 YkgJ family cysteine cluster protein [Euryarchaeota archaeon]MDA8610592.1 YkgJ family cysteine cluster protein [Euryarchaeota archaeon]